jgi:hypothetical protein
MARAFAVGERDSQCRGSAGGAGLTARVPLVFPPRPGQAAGKRRSDRETDDDENDEATRASDRRSGQVPATPEEYSWHGSANFVDTLARTST